MSCVKLWMTWWYHTIILYPGVRVHSSGAHSVYCAAAARWCQGAGNGVLMSPSQTAAKYISQPGWHWTAHHYKLFPLPPRNEAHDNGSVTLVHLVHCVNKHTPTFPIMFRTIMNILNRRLQQLILIFQTIKQLSQCPFLTQAVHYNIIPDIHHITKSAVNITT